MQKPMKTIKTQFLNAVKNRVLIVGPMADHKPPPFGPTLYIDGGMKWWSDTASNAQLSIGDGDSIASDPSRKLDLQFPPEKDASDLSLGLRLLNQQNLKIWLWGFLGGDKAHELANLGAVAHWLEGRTDSAALLDHHILIVSAGSWQLKLPHAFSILSLVPNEITVKGDCQYKLQEPTPLAALSSFGLSNLGSGVVQFSARRPLLILGRPQFQSLVLEDLVFCKPHP